MMHINNASVSIQGPAPIIEPPRNPSPLEYREQHHSEALDNGNGVHAPITWAIEWKLYVSHFLSTWNSRSFEFASVLFLAHIYPNTLLYLSLYAIVRSASAIVFAPMIGRAIDKCARIWIVRISISERSKFSAGKHNSG